MQTPPAGSSPSNYPRPNFAPDRQNLRDIAVGQRNIIYCILAQIGVVIANNLLALLQSLALSLVGAALAIGVLIFMIISVMRLAKALGFSQVLYVIFMFVPCVSLIVLLMLSSKASARLKDAGFKVGLMGVDPKSI